MVWRGQTNWIPSGEAPLRGLGNDKGAEDPTNAATES